MTDFRIESKLSASAYAASVSNSDETLTISPTTGAVVASLNLGSPNVWTGQQTFSNATYSALFTGGNVGIGTPTPTSLLDVNGTVTARTNIISTTGKLESIEIKATIYDQMAIAEQAHNNIKTLNQELINRKQSQPTTEPQKAE